MLGVVNPIDVIYVFIQARGGGGGGGGGMLQRSGHQIVVCRKMYSRIWEWVLNEETVFTYCNRDSHYKPETVVDLWSRKMLMIHPCASTSYMELPLWRLVRSLRVGDFELHVQVLDDLCP